MASEKNIGFDIELLKELNSKLPETEKRRRNFIDIAGYPNWENVNSNILAYYFDETEDHGFKTLFIDSLLDVYSGTLEGEFNEMISESGFYVEREVTTKKGNRIDILIRSFKEEENEVTNNGWAVIIENKIDAPLNNDLKDYWESIEADTKIGILLSLRPTPVNNKNFVNITHKQMIEKIQENLSEFYLDADDRHLLLLKEYISNINNRYRSREEDQKMEQTLWLFHEYSSTIKELEKKQKELLRYINRCVDKVMEEHGFPPNTNINNANAKHYQVTEESDLPESFSEADRDLLMKFRFWIPLSTLRFNGDFESFFELFDKEAIKKYGNNLQQGLQVKNLSTENIGLGRKKSSDFVHLYYISFRIDKDNSSSFEKQLEKKLNDNLFKHPHNYLSTVVSELKKLSS